ncbi:MAG: polysaccharide deacetylase family protein [Treponema sp.]|nr:polysaccharide deacetylase family protein [Treponema sp.]
MRYTEIPFFCLAFFIPVVLSGCMSINRTREAMRIPDGFVIFSFDDGPNAHTDTTARLLDVLRKYDIQALFVLLGENVDRYPELAGRIRDEGHLVVNHGYTDKWAAFMGAEEFTFNLLRGEETLDGNLNLRLYRPQGGMYRKSQQKIWQEKGYTLVPATVRPCDAVKKKASREKIIKKIIDGVTKQGGGLIVLHDARDSYTRMEKYLDRDPEGEFNRSWIPEMVEELIGLLLERGYRVNGFDITEILDIETG